ncbi:MAG: type VI secretion system protein TssA [Holosporaceae bacterium]|jgi:type VI secretion system protein ImpA|nr:type VI secretion system protein TssA [Holosporaceae bacterium]
MTTDIVELLSPISENNRCGEDLKYDFIYDKIKELRREDDIRLSQGIWQTEPKKANWSEVSRVCSNLLKAKTKDLQIAMWLLESWTVTEQFHGFNRGVSLLLALCENFWDDIYPSIDRENHSFTSRLSPFYFFAEKIQGKIVLIPIVESRDGLSENYTLSDWMTARHNLQIKNTKGLSLKQLKKSVFATPIEFFQTLKREVELSIEGLKKLDAFIAEKCENDAPSFRALFDCLEDIKRTTDKNLADKQSQIAERSPKQPQNNQSDVSKDSDSGLSEKPAPKGATIEQAYAAMLEIAAFLEKEQPQSPASTLIQIASAIGKKNFQELLEINMKSGTPVMNTISELYRILITKPEDNKLH